ncbi:MAG: Lrp/AsnC ligand binding domain-containing protein [SAR324 cluster bacterium]|jgi:DNA-binding Lrp family transcriptional regulator|nr:AsnC family transcriptional regulator [Deltaproteobacteria bacterium]MAD99144.1 AsnC family transcriptional regulator [Pseudomonadota bacterium]MDP6093019.1 Lrp/AsnC ligand binding domain-containing protein [SAR324 cluster bacterium]MBI13996.1 AsnC family transcriptional regulator [Deltaproteobacteria bacterium]MBI14414.1 AsnC family transcriptional regulator [Deltaproteobacteria bacterium]|tara:strand:- start:396 stop:671 length:276 start_codon:yes stop_codon:yes gene_type:complete
MVTALVMLNVERKYIQNVSQSLVDMKQVTEVYSVAGRYDLVAIVRVNNNAEIADTITGKFSTLEGITATETLIAFNTFSRHDLEHMFSIGE